MSNQIVLEAPLGTLQGSYRCGLLCDLIHAEGAEVMATYGRDFYQGMPSLTRNTFSEGQAWYVASSPEPRFLEGLVLHLCTEQNIKPIMDTPLGVEVTRRHKWDETYLFLLNHNKDASTVTLASTRGRDLLSGQEVAGAITLPGYGVMIVQVES